MKRSEALEVLVAASCPICDGIAAFPPESRNGILVRACRSCGMIRQVAEKTPAELAQWYSQYHAGFYSHSVAQDRTTAQKRLLDIPGEWLASPKARILDVGCGNGALLMELQSRGFESLTGVDCDPRAARTTGLPVHAGAFEEALLPARSQDVAFATDVFEHVPNPKRFLREMRRVLALEGKLYLEIPDFFLKGGERHWRAIEHLWMFSEEDVRFLLKQSGFQVLRVIRKQDCAKLAFIAQAVPVQRPLRILVPPGAGDIYWSLVKIPGFLRSIGREGEIPEIIISSPDPEKDRSLAYVQSVPFVHAVGYLRQSPKSPAWSAIWQEAYHEDGRRLFQGIEGCDAFLAYNGVLRWGKSLELVDEEWGAEWMIPLHRSIEERAFEESLRSSVGRYIIGYVVTHGMYSKWLAEFGLDCCARSFREAAEELDAKVVLVGASWDRGFAGEKEALAQLGDRAVNLVGQTTWAQLMGAMHGAEGVMGLPSGITILSTTLRKPTMLWWNQFFHRDFWRNACPPQSWLEWYRAEDTRTASPETSASLLSALVQRERPWGQLGGALHLGKEPGGMRKKIPLPKAKCALANGPTRPDLPQELGIRGPGREIAFLAVLRSGGDFGPLYVERLRDGLKRNCPFPHQLLCLSDLNGEVSRLGGISVVPLRHGWPGWWSKIELFREDLPLPPEALRVYLDLDSVITGDLSPVLRWDFSFGMVQGWRIPERRSSTMMAWQGNAFAPIYSSFANRDSATILKRPQDWDQDYILARLRGECRTEPAILQRHLGMMSFKRHGLSTKGSLPPEVAVVAFHGKPRPHELAQQPNPPKWFLQHWGKGKA